MPDYGDDRRWSDKFIPRIKEIVGPLAMGIAPDANDHHEATDLMVIDAHDMRIAARMRKFGFFDEHGHEITIRLNRVNGSETEFLKIVKGFGRWFFYGHANKADDDIEHWMLIDLNQFRAALIYDANTSRKVKFFTKQNTDGTTSFRVFDMRTFPQAVFVARSSAVAKITESVE